MTPATAGGALPAFMDYERLSATCGVALKQFRNGEMVHAYLLTGARGLGKRTFARVLASALFCASAHKPCGACRECRRVMDGSHPDVLTLFSDDGKQIGVDRVRDLIRETSRHSLDGGFRVVMIEPVERMTAQAQNCLLKSLEEPQTDVVYLLMTHELTATLGTIASRCVRIKLAPWSDESMRAALSRLGYSEGDISRALPLAGGNIGEALELIQKNADDALNAFVREALSLKSDASTVGVSTKLKESRDGADRYLNALEQAIHLALMVRTGEADASALREYPPVWQAASLRAPTADFTALLQAVFDARRLRAGQVNWQSNIDHLLMKLLEEQTKWQQLLA